MKWNIEWVDLQNIERMIAECWRLGDKQLQQYYDKLLQQKDLVFAGPIGLTFLGLLNGLLMEDVSYGWSELQKDVHMLQKLIQQGAKQDRHYWHMQYHELNEQPEFYFYTALGQTFMEQIAEKLELHVSEEHKFLRHDIQMIQKICETCDWQNEEMAKNAIAYLKEKEQMVFHSWVGFDFVQKVQERFGEKEEPVQLPQPEGKTHRFFRKKLLKQHQNQSGEKFAKDTASQYRDEIDDAILKELDSLDEFDIINDQEAILSQGLPYDDADKDARQGASGKHKSVVKTIGLFFIGLCFVSFAGLWLVMQKQEKSVHDIWMQIASMSCDKNAADVLEIEFDHNQDLPDQADAQYRNKTMDASEPSMQSQIEDSKSLDSQTESVANSPDAAGTDENQNRQADKGVQAKSRANSNGRADTGVLSEGKQKIQMPEILPQYEEFHSQYPDLFGWLKIPDTEIDHPVMQAEEYVNGQRYFYLNHDYAGNQTEQGSLFVDSKSSCFPQDHNTVIYGHNMSNGHNFGMLERYQDIEFCRAHQTFYYDTIYETGKYQIIAVLKSRVLYQEEEGFRYYHRRVRVR